MKLPDRFARRATICLVTVAALITAAPSALNAILNFVAVGNMDPTLRGQLIERLVGLLVPIGAGIYLIARPGRLIEYLQRPLPEHATEME